MKRLMIATALAMLTTSAYANELTCIGRVEAWTGYSEITGKIESVFRVIGEASCNDFFVNQASVSGRRILQGCPIGSLCRVKAHSFDFSDDGGPEAVVISVERIK